MPQKLLFFIILLYCLLVVVFTSNAKIDVESIPVDFTRFQLGEHKEQSDLLNHYMWYHYKSRLGVMQGVFPLEYLTTSDMWLAGAIHPLWEQKEPIQDIHRNVLLNIKMSPDGYINTHQHYSHSHEQGWPFPLWIQGYSAENKSGAVGWHFNHSGTGWMWDLFFSQQPDSRFSKDKALQGWTLENIRSLGIVDNKWKLKATGLSPSITIPKDVAIDAFNAPYLQLRWNRSAKTTIGILPYVEWKRCQDKDFSQDRRVYFDTNSGNPEYEKVSSTKHSMITMYNHPLWNGKIKQLRIVLAPGKDNVEFDIDSFFTVYDTRQAINNPIYIFSCWNYFRWTGDVEFLKLRINQMRQALKFQQTVLGGLKYNHIRNIMPGHDGLPGITPHPDKQTTVNYGHGIGSNYWDILAFGWDDMYSTNQYYASTLVMADIEQAIKENPQWGIPQQHLAFDPEKLRGHAAQIKKTANSKFWNKKNGRFIGCIDKNGNKHDYGFTFLNLDSIWYGTATKTHAKKIMDWITGKRIIKNDTSKGKDIYKWRFGPRATTLRNLQWYQFVWTQPETLPWGGQVQDGGAVLGFTFYDLWARLHIISSDNAWQRLEEIFDWQKEVSQAGGYRNFYKDGKQGTTLQGGGTAGGLGIDHEFYESSLLPSIITYGFLGIDPKANSLAISPKLPKACPQMSIKNLLYHYVRMDITASKGQITVTLKDNPANSINLNFSKKYKNSDINETNSSFELTKSGTYNFKYKQ